ncbi:VIT1/CCC1 transporter family protein [Sediminispirochaeta smaragdinae]|nr:VIT1/CCC1 transporter family protein [Sediminispirochaeta smaragdinae]
MLETVYTFDHAKEKIMDMIAEMQRNEITEYQVYRKIAKREKDPENQKVLLRIAEEEKRHHDIWARYTGGNAKPKRFKVWFFPFLARLLGLTFAVKLMELGESSAAQAYTKLAETVPEAKGIVDDEERHEAELLRLLNEQRLEYVGSIVLGLNDALVELTGALAGLTFAFRNGSMIAAAGLITGIAASFSMAASEYLSNQSEGNHEKALTSAVYTGIAYIVTVTLLILPFFIFSNSYVSLGVTLLVAALIILGFTFYISVAKELPFRRRFLEMISLSFGVAAISFALAALVRTVFGIDA